MSELTPFDGRLGRAVEDDGARWTVIFDEHTRQLALRKRVEIGLDPRLLRIALRTGAMVPAPEMLAELEGPVPDALVLRVDEAKVWEAVLEGDRGQRTLSHVDRQRIVARLARLR